MKTMKKTLILLGLFITGVIYGQNHVINVGRVDAYSKTQSDAKYLDQTGFTMEIDKDSNPDTLMVINNDEVGYALSSDLSYNHLDFFSYDTVPYWLPTINSLALTTGTYATNTLRAFPFYVGDRFVFDGIAIDVSTGQASGHVIMGIYSDTSSTKNGRHYPGTLVYKTPVIDASSAAVVTHNKTADIILQEDKIYWYAISTDNSSIAVRSIAIGAMGNILGYTTGTNGASYTSISGARNYDGDLPTTYPAGHAKSNSNIPCLFLRLK